MHSENTRANKNALRGDQHRQGGGEKRLADFQRDLGKVGASQGGITLHELCAFA